MPDARFFVTDQSLTLNELATRCGLTLLRPADGARVVTSVAPIETAGAKEITFFSNAKYKEAFQNTKAEACIISEKHTPFAPENTAILIADDPYYAYACVAAILHPEKPQRAGIDPSAAIHPLVKVPGSCRIAKDVVIEKNAQIEENVSIGAGSYIGEGVIIGANSRIAPQVTITHAILGKNVILHPGVRIGQDGFGFASHRGVHHKVPQLGRVVVQDDVEIGANSCIDRGTNGDTLIGAGTKIDNLVQIGHNVQTGRGCIIVSQVGISGSTVLGDYVVIGGQGGLAGHLKIGSGANIAAQSGVMRDAAPKEILGGSPAVPIREWHRQTVALKKLIEKK